MSAWVRLKKDKGKVLAGAGMKVHQHAAHERKDRPMEFGKIRGDMASGEKQIT